MSETSAQGEETASGVLGNPEFSGSNTANDNQSKDLVRSITTTFQWIPCVIYAVLQINADTTSHLKSLDDSQNHSNNLNHDETSSQRDVQPGAYGDPVPPEADLAGSNLEGLRVIRCIDWLRDRILDGSLGSEDAEMVHLLSHFFLREITCNLFGIVPFVHDHV